MLGKSISKNSIALALFAVATTAMIASTFLGTKDRIAEQERIARAKALLEIFPADTHNNSLLDDTISITAPELGIDGEQLIYVARQDDNIVGFIFSASAPDGYSGDIGMIVGLRPDGSIAGLRVLTHNETPGLGDKVDLKKSDWVLSFNNKSLTNPTVDNWKVKKDKGEFDQFTGATITPRAVVNTVRTVLQYYTAQQASLLETSAVNTDTEANDNG